MLKHHKFFQSEEGNMIENAQINSAILIFDKFEVKEKLRKFYRAQDTWFFQKKKVWPQKHLFMEKYQLDIEFDTQEPENYKWENLDISKKESFKRKTGVICLIVLVIIPTVIFLLINNALSTTTTGACNMIYFTRGDLVSATKGKTSIKECFCTYMFYLNSTENATAGTGFDYENDTDFLSLCESYNEDDSSLGNTIIFHFKFNRHIYRLPNLNCH